MPYFFFVYISNNDSQCIFVDVGDNVFKKDLVIIQMFYQTLHTYL
jgi:hypothetical protein